MDTIPTQSEFPEHIIFEAFQSEQRRLRKMLRYQPQPSKLDDGAYGITRMALKQLEQDLRETLRIEIEVDDLKLTAMSNANDLLKSLYTMLESVVNIDLLPPNWENWAHHRDQYPRLITLVNVLKSQSWDFDLVLGAQVDKRTLFKVKSDDMVGKLDTAANQFNTCVGNIYQRPLQEIEPTSFCTMSMALKMLVG